MEESSLVDPSIAEIEAVPVRVTYEIVEEGTKRRRHKLVDNVGVLVQRQGARKVNHLLAVHSATERQLLQSDRERNRGGVCSRTTQP